MKKILVSALLLLTLLALPFAFVGCSGKEVNRVEISTPQNSDLLLSETGSFDNPINRLTWESSTNLDNSTLSNYLDKKLSDICSTDGFYKGDDSYCIAATFYLKNGGKDTVYREKITLSEDSGLLPKALRILLIKDIDPLDDGTHGTITVYAAPKSDADGNTLKDNNGNPILEEVVPPDQHFAPNLKYRPTEIEAYDKYLFNAEDIREDGVWMTKAFASDTCVLESDYYPLENGDIIKYTLVIWLEGQDEQCVNDILGEHFNLSFTFEEAN